MWFLFLQSNVFSSWMKSKLILLEHYVCMCILKFLMHEVVNCVVHHISLLANVLVVYSCSCNCVFMYSLYSCSKLCWKLRCNVCLDKIMLQNPYVTAFLILTRFNLYAVHSCNWYLEHWVHICWTPHWKATISWEECCTPIRSYNRSSWNSIIWDLISGTTSQFFLCHFCPNLLLYH